MNRLCNHFVVMESVLDVGSRFPTYQPHDFSKSPPVFEVQFSLFVSGDGGNNLTQKVIRRMACGCSLICAHFSPYVNIF